MSDKFYLGYIDENVTSYLNDIIRVKLEDNIAIKLSYILDLGF